MLNDLSKAVLHSGFINAIDGIKHLTIHPIQVKERLRCRKRNGSANNGMLRSKLP
jgi:hypothetical protein